jgi:uncharacterized protein (TIGR00730 family)
MNIVVFLGSNEGKKPLYRERVRKLGSWIAREGHILVYGGSRSGLMGQLAQAAQAEKGKVIGVEPEFFIRQGVVQMDLSELIVTETMAERKQKMIELGEAFLAFPGGIGTLEEITEVMTLTFLGKLSRPIIFYNVDGFYDRLKEELDYMVKEGFLLKENLERVHFVRELEEIQEIFRNQGKSML